MLERIAQLQKKIATAMELLKVPALTAKLEQLAATMSEPGFWQDQKKAQTISQDYQDIKSEVEKWESLATKARDLYDLAAAGDARLEVELAAQVAELEQQFEQYELALLLNGPYDANNALVSVHAGAGGTEAQDWAEMLVRMLLRFCESQKWRTEVLDESRGAEAGYKSFTFRVVGKNAFGYIKSEHGVHRLVRISPFDAEKMRHTSFALVEVLPELDESVAVEIKPEDLRIDTFMSGGKGGQSVNTTYSAVRIVHIPTGISVQCQNERSQTQNKEMAMKILRARLHRLEEEKKAKAKQELRGEFKSAEWGNQIRSYVLHPYHLVNDHRTEFKSTDPEAVLEGKLLPLCQAYLQWIKE